MNREEMIKDTEEKLEALRAGYEEYLWTRQLLKHLTGGSSRVPHARGEVTVTDFILEAMGNGEPYKANEIKQLLDGDSYFSRRDISYNQVSSRLSNLVRDGRLIKLPLGQGYRIAPDKKEKR